MEKEEIIDAVRDYLDADDWHYEYEADRNIIRASMLPEMCRAAVLPMSIPSP